MASSAPPLDETELDAIHAFAVNLAKDAGQMLLAAVQARSSTSPAGRVCHVEKESAVDLVTQTDDGESCFYLSFFGVLRPERASSRPFGFRAL
jgi:myo-inositol-1(or 4)-monophosphatase